MPTITAQQLTSAGFDASTDGTAADAGGDQVRMRKNLILVFLNEDASPTTITVATAGTIDGNAIDDPQLVVPANDVGIMRIDGGIYADSSGFVQLTYSSVTSLTVLALYID